MTCGFEGLVLRFYGIASRLGVMGVGQAGT
jgi:hypothetical protein